MQTFSAGGQSGLIVTNTPEKLKQYIVNNDGWVKSGCRETLGEMYHDPLEQI